MKALLMRIAVGIIGLVGLVYFLACSPPPPPNSNVGQNIGQNQNQANGNMSKADLRPCDYGSDPGSHGQHIKDEIKEHMGASLKKLLKDADNPNGTFTLEVTKAQNGTYFVARIRGRVSGDDNLKELSNILNDFQDRQDCLRVVYFLPESTSSSEVGEPGFEWSSCEYPLHVCPNGECCMPTESNTNANVNTNTNTAPANFNANGSRSTNTNN
jgi:hypothetical protein